MGDAELDFRLVRKEAPDGKRYLALNLGRDYLETSIFLMKEDLEFLFEENVRKVGSESDTDSGQTS